MSKQQIITSKFNNLSASLTALKEQSEQNRRAAAYFASVDTIILQPRGTVRTTESIEAMKVQEFRAPSPDPEDTTKVVWSVVKAKVIERKLRVTRFCDVIDQKTGEKSGEILLVATVRTYEDAKGTIVGVSSKNTRFRAEHIVGKELLRAHGHVNTWEHEYKGEKIVTQVFNANGIGLANKVSDFAERQVQQLKDRLASMPGMEGLPE